MNDLPFYTKSCTFHRGFNIPYIIHMTIMIFNIPIKLSFKTSVAAQ